MSAKGHTWLLQLAKQRNWSTDTVVLAGYITNATDMLRSFDLRRSGGITHYEAGKGLAGR